MVFPSTQQLPKAEVEDKTEAELEEFVAQYRDNPLGFVESMFPWLEPDTPLEKEEGPDTWQADILITIGEECLKRNDNVLTTAIRIAVASGHGVGKAISNSTIIDTPMGNRRWGDLKPGDYVFGKDGKPTRIVSIYPQGRKPIYRVTFDDESSTLTCAEHLWRVHHRKLGWRNRSTKELLSAGVRKPNGSGRLRHYHLPRHKAVEYPYQWVPVDPYTLGAWLGDGCRNTSRITNMDEEVFDHIRDAGYRLTEGNSKSSGRARVFNIGHLRPALERLGIDQCGAHTKYVPGIYKYNLEEVRAEVLRGLIDTDGFVTPTGTVQFTSASKRLVTDVMWLTRSLGGKARLYKSTRNNAYTCSLTFPDGFRPCYIERKFSRIRQTTQKRYLERYIDRIEPAGESECMCISVEAEDCLYLVNDFIVTHNTALVAWIILWFISTRGALQIVVTANTQVQLQTKTWRELAKWHRLIINEHWFRWSATQLKSVENPETHFATAVPWSKSNVDAFAGTHEENVLIVFDEACHDDKTEVLTRKGWKYFKDATPEDEFLSMHPETHEAEYLKAVRMHKYMHNGLMHLCDRRNTNFCVTPNHKLYVRKHNRRCKDHWADWEFIKAKELGRINHRIKSDITWVEPDKQVFVLPAFKGAYKSWSDKAIKFDLWAEFLGWYCTEGCVMVRDGKAYSTSITQGEGAELERIYKLCCEMGFNAKLYRSPTTPQVKIHSRQLAEHLVRYGSNCKNKRVPDEIKNASARQIKVFINTCVKGDGYKKSQHSDIIYTSSKRLADDYQELVLKTGRRCSLRKRALTGIASDFGTHIGVSSCDGWVVTIKAKYLESGIQSRAVKTIHYKGMVYCVELPKYNLLLTRRNGLCMWSGNSKILDQIWEVTEGALTQKGAIWIAFGNPTRNEGRFRDCFKKFRHRWITRQVDSRTAKKANKDQIEEWMTDYGDDSDFARVRVKGQFPRVSDMQFIPLNLVEEARARKLEFKDYRDSPIIVSADIARFGNDKTVITIRQGNKLIEQREYREIDLMTALAFIAKAEDEYDAQGVFIDETGGLGAGIIDRARQLLRKWFGYIGGSKSSSAKYFNKRAEVYGMTREWLKHADLSNLDQKTYQFLEDDLTAVQYGFSANGDKLQLERKEDLKKRDLASPDFSDSLTIGFTQVVRPKFDPNKDRYGAQERLRKARKRAMRHQGRNIDTGY